MTTVNELLEHNIFLSIFSQIRIKHRDMSVFYRFIKSTDKNKTKSSVFGGVARCRIKEVIIYSRYLIKLTLHLVNDSLNDCNDE